MKSLEDSIHELSLSYVQSWGDTAHKVEKMGAYSKIAAHIPPHHGKHLDIGSGKGHFLRALHAVMPEAELFGVDRSEHMVGAARRNLSRDGIEAKTYLKTALKREGKTGGRIEIQKTYVPDPEKIEAFRKDPCRIKLIADDIREAQVLTAILNGELDSGSITCPGVGNDALLIHPFPMDSHTLSPTSKEGVERHREHMNRTNNCGVQFLTRNIKPGGTFVWAQLGMVSEIPLTEWSPEQAAESAFRAAETYINPANKTIWERVHGETIELGIDPHTAQIAFRKAGTTSLVDKKLGDTPVISIASFRRK